VNRKEANKEIDSISIILKDVAVRVDKLSLNEESLGEAGDLIKDVQEDLVFIINCLKDIRKSNGR